MEEMWIQILLCKYISKQSNYIQSPCGRGCSYFTGRGTYGLMAEANALYGLIIWPNTTSFITIYYCKKTMTHILNFFNLVCLFVLFVNSSSIDNQVLHFQIFPLDFFHVFSFISFSNITLIMLVGCLHFFAPSFVGRLFFLPTSCLFVVVAIYVFPCKIPIVRVKGGLSSCPYCQNLNM